MIRWSISPLSPPLRAVIIQNWRCIPLRRRLSAALTPSVSHFTAQPDLGANPPPMEAAQFMSKNARKRLLKQQRHEANKAEKKARVKEHHRRELERKRKEWEERLAGVDEEERERVIEAKRGRKKERMEAQLEERGKEIERLKEARINGQNVVIDLEFSHLMDSFELVSLIKQITCCYGLNRRCALPAHIWLTGCHGEMQNLLLQIPGYDKWVVEKETQPYIEVFKEQKENLVYLTPDSDNVLDDLDPKAICIIGGLVDRNRLKHVTKNKAREQGIKTAKLPIATYMKMSTSQVLTVNQVVEILLKFVETRDWNNSFYQVIPQRKRFEAGSHNKKDVDDQDDGRMVEQVAEPEDGVVDQDRMPQVDQMSMRRCIEAL